MRTVLSVLLAVAVVVVGAAWMYGSPEPAEVPEESHAGGWKETNREDSSYGAGLVKVRQVAYGKANSDYEGVMVVTIGDLPVLDESRFIPDALDKVAAKNGLRLEKRGSEDVQLPNVGLTVPGTLYDVYSDSYPGSARAIVVDFPCPDRNGYVVVVGYGLLGGIPGFDNTFSQARSMVRNVAC